MARQNVNIAKNDYMTLKWRNDVHVGFSGKSLRLIAYVVQKL